MRKPLLFLFISLFSFFSYGGFSVAVSNIEKQHADLFSGDIKPYKVIEDYYSSTGLPGDVEDESKVYYTKNDQEILNERKRVLGPLPLLGAVFGILSIASGIAFIVLLYVRISDLIDEKRKEKREKMIQVSVEKGIENEKEQIRQFIEKLEKMIERHESSGTIITDDEISNIRKEMDRLNSNSTRVKAEHIIKNHKNKKGSA
ncbi:hypothetical protein [Neobacillus bataviensis]|uniref:hypothetical protein n=1 Tax=Neobacillus bataviensis TaxID=220685 RepID=UPI001CBC8351|nr:hypothetical protein [Neobacillus bataviensis]